MTDFSNRPNSYFTASVYNNQETDLLANFDITQNAPFVKTANDYQAAIDKAKITLNVPLTETNIPLKTYSTILRQTLPNGDVVEGQAFVRQLNASNENFVYNLDFTLRKFSKYIYTSTGALTLIFDYTIPITVANGYGPMIVDDYENLYLACNTTGNTTFNNLIIFDYTGAVINSYEFDSIQCLAISPDQTLYVADESLNDGSVVRVYSNNNYVSSVTLTISGTISQNAAGQPLTSIATVCADSQILIGYNNNHLTLYNTNLSPINDFTETSINNLANPSAMLSSANRFVLVDQGQRNNFLFGERLSDGVFVDAVANTELITSGYFDTTSAPSTIISGYAFGNDATGNTLATTYSNGVFGSPFNVQNNPLVHSVCSFSDSLSLVGVANSANDLLFWDVNNIVNNTWYSVCPNFEFAAGVNASLIQYRPSSKAHLYGVGTDNLFYAGSDVYPKRLYTSAGVLSPSQPAEIREVGFGYNISGEAVGEMNNILIDAPSVSGAVLPTTNIDMFQSSTTGDFFTLIVDSANTVYISKQTSSLTPISSVPLAPLLGNILPNKIFEVVNQGFGLCYDGITVFYDETITQQQVINTTGQTTGSALLNVVNVTALIEGASLTLYDTFDITNPIPSLITIPDLISSVTGMPSSQTLVSLNTICASGNDFYIVGTSSVAQAGTFDVLIKCVFDVNYLSLLSATVVYANGNFSGTSVNFISQNQILSEIYLVKPGFQQVDVFNYGSNTITSTIYTTKFTIQNYIYVPYIIKGQNTFSSIPFSGVTGIKSFTFSKKNPNQIFVVNTADDLVYVGNLAYPIVFTRYNDIVQTMNSIGSSAPITGNYNSTAYCFNLTQGQTLVGSYNVPNKLMASVGKNAISRNGSGEFVISVLGTSAISFNPTDFSVLWTNTGNFWGEIYTKDSADTFAGNAQVWTYDVLLKQINASFVTAFSRLLANGGTIASAPFLTLDTGTGLATLNYSLDYTSEGNGILFNKRLHQLVYFDSLSASASASGYYFNILPLGSTLLTQNVLSFWIFNQLEKIVFISNTLFFLEANTFGNNQSTNVFADFDVPISQAGYNMNNISNVLYIQPNFLNPLILSSTAPIVRVQIQVFYQYQDGKQYPLYIPYGQNFSAKLIFMKRFA